MHIRQVEVYIGKQNEMRQLAISSDSLFVSFRVSKTNTIQPNTATVEIYNLNSQSRAFLENISGPRWIVIRAGYLDEIGAQDIYKGTILTSMSQKTSPNIVTTIEAQDGVYQSNIRTAIGYGKGTPVKTILNDIVGKMGLSIAPYSCDIPTRILSSFSTVGKAHDALTRLCSMIGIQWSIQDGKVKFTKTGEGDRGEIYRISVNSGMIGSPKRIINAVPSSDFMTAGVASSKVIISNGGSPTLTVPGWEVESLLIPTIEPKSVVQIDSMEMGNGEKFIVETVEHNGDTANGDFKTKLKVYKKR